MSMTLLQIVSNFCSRTGLPVPTTVYGTTDPQVTQVRALLEEEGNDLASRGSWQGLINEASLTTTATESQGAMSFNEAGAKTPGKHGLPHIDTSRSA